MHDESIKPDSKGCFLGFASLVANLASWFCHCLYFHLRGLLTMNFFLSSRLVRPFTQAVGACVSTVGHMLMRGAVSVSLKLCLLTARVLLNSPSNSQPEQAL